MKTYPVTYAEDGEPAAIRTNLEVAGRRVVLYADATGLVRQIKGREGDTRIDQDVAEVLRTIRGWTVGKAFAADYEPPTEIVEVLDPDNDPDHPDYIAPMGRDQMMQIEMREALAAQRRGRVVSHEDLAARRQAQGRDEAPVEADPQGLIVSLHTQLAVKDAEIAGLRAELDDVLGLIRRLASKDDPEPTKVVSPTRGRRKAPTAAQMGKDNRSRAERGDQDPAVATAAPKVEAFEGIARG